MSTIGTIGSSTASTGMENLHARKRPNPEEMAASLFSKLDTSGQGYLQKSDLQNALDKVSASSSGTSSSTASTADALFAKLDSDGDGKVTKDEFSSTLKKLSEQLDNHFATMRMQGGMNGANGAGGMPPPPPGDAGFTKDELSSQLEEIGSSDSDRSALISNIVQNFDKADTNGDGKVSFQEAMAYQQASASSATSSTSTSTTGDTATATGQTTAANSGDDLRLMRQIMHLMHAYNIGGATQSSSTITATA